VSRVTVRSLRLANRAIVSSAGFFNGLTRSTLWQHDDRSCFTARDASKNRFYRYATYLP
jgi:hypothetical protein